jgi:hypothetical protein
VQHKWYTLFCKCKALSSILIQTKKKEEKEIIAKTHMETPQMLGKLPPHSLWIKKESHKGSKQIFLTALAPSLYFIHSYLFFHSYLF